MTTLVLSIPIIIEGLTGCPLRSKNETAGSWYRFDSVVAVVAVLVRILGSLSVETKVTSSFPSIVYGNDLRQL
jgi:hypothetical protein